jgi:hypothetical protein
LATPAANMAAIGCRLRSRHIDSGTRLGRHKQLILCFRAVMDGDLSDIPDDLEALKAALVAERGRRITAEADAAAAQAKVSSAEALIAHMKLQIAKLRR